MPHKIKFNFQQLGMPELEKRHRNLALHLCIAQCCVNSRGEPDWNTMERTEE